MAKKQKEMEGEVYYPSEEVIVQANAKDWDAMAASALKDPQAFWEAEANELEELVIAGFVSGIWVGHSARHHAADRQHVAEILLDLADRGLERGQHAIGVGFGPARLV